MSAVSNDRVLRIALAGSLAVHLVFAAVVHSSPVTAAPEQIAKHIYVLHLRKPTPTPRPPKPALPHPQRKSAAVRPAMQRIHVAVQPRHSGPVVEPPVEATGEPNPVDTFGPDAPPTSGPVVIPTPTPKPACSAPDVPAKAVVTQSPIVPDDARSEGFVGTAKVQVDLDASGNVIHTSIYESTGSMDLDRAAVEAAKQSRYAPEERDCKDVSGSYLFTVDFQ